MITKYKQFNESIKSKLVGPTIKELLDTFELEYPFEIELNSPKEFLLSMIDGVKILEQNKYPNIVFWEKDGVVIFEQDIESKQLWIVPKIIHIALYQIFGLKDYQMLSLIENIVEEKLNIKGYEPSWNYNYGNFRWVNLDQYKNKTWKSIGYDKSFDTPEEFFLHLIDGMTIKEETKDKIIWTNNNKIIFINDLKFKVLNVNYDELWSILVNNFDLKDTEIKTFIKNMVEKHLKWFGIEKLDVFFNNMIREHKQFNESIRSLLVGPSKEDINEYWKSKGYDKPFDTPEEFFINVIGGIRINKKTRDVISWKKNDKKIFELYLRHKLLFVDLKTVWSILENAFGLDKNETQTIIIKMVKKYLNLEVLSTQPMNVY